MIFVPGSTRANVRWTSSLVEKYWSLLILCSTTYFEDTNRRSWTEQGRNGTRIKARKEGEQRELTLLTGFRASFWTRPLKALLNNICKSHSREIYVSRSRPRKIRRTDVCQAYVSEKIIIFRLRTIDDKSRWMTRHVRPRRKFPVDIHPFLFALSRYNV